MNTVNYGRIIKSGINVSIIGRPNIGKSSLLNAILKKDRAIVTDIAGTTRDTLEEKIEKNGVFINFIDTAGIRDTSDQVEKIGVDRALNSAENADIVVMMLDAGRKICDEEIELLDKFKNKPVLKVYNKMDLGKDKDNNDGLFVSAKTGENIHLILDKICDYFMQGIVDSSGDVITNIRHIEALKSTYDFISNALIDCENTPSECILIDLKASYLELGKSQETQQARI